MTFNNSVLLAIKQNPGVDFNDLLTKISSRYKNPSSARSALSRSVKNLVSFGLAKREGSKLLITGKGLSSINLEMKDKLILRLNEELRKQNPDFGEIIKFLIVLNQRGREDKDLLNNAKENAHFSIRDIEDLRRKIGKQRTHLRKISLLLEGQAEKLRELDFNDSVEVGFDSDAAAHLAVFCRGQRVVVETSDGEALSKIPDHWKKQGAVSVEGDNITLLIQLFSSMPSAKAVLYIPGAKIILSAGKVTIFGSHKKIKSFHGISASDAAENLPPPANSVEEKTDLPPENAPTAGNSLQGRK